MIRDTVYDAGVKTDYLLDDGKVYVSKTQDVSGLLDYAKWMRNEEGVHGDMVKYASIPVVIIEELYKKGINVYQCHTKGDMKRLISEIDTNYPYLKTTNLKGGTNNGK